MHGVHPKANANPIRNAPSTVLPPFKAPKQIVLADALPKTERGKLDRKALAERWHKDSLALLAARRSG